MAVDLVQLVDVEELGRGEFVLGDDETVDFVLVEVAGVEDDEQLVASAGCGAQSRTSTAVRSTSRSSSSLTSRAPAARGLSPAST